MSEDYSIVMFDGVCNFCNSFVTWVIERDPKGKFKFCSLQSELGRNNLERLGLEDNLSTVVLIEPGDVVYTKSDAVFSILNQLDTPYAYLSFLKYLPRFIRDSGYNVFGSLRYFLFGQGDKSACAYNMSWRSRFLVIDEESSKDN